MLQPAEFKLLSRWCRAHALRETKTTNEDGLPALRLECDGRGNVCKQMVLFHREGQFHLIDESGNALATSSSLQSVLDALGGGIAEKEQPKRAGWWGYNGDVASFLFSA